MRPEILAVAESPMVQIATIAESMPGSIKLCYGESESPTPDFICRAATDAMAAGHTYYTHTAGSPAFREAIAGHVHALHGVEYRATEIMGSVGATAAIFAAIRAFAGAGDNVVIVSPAYAIFANGVRLVGAEPRLVPLAFGGGRFALDLDRIGLAIDTRTRMLIVNSPSNPTGWTVTVDEQRALCDLAERHDLFLLADEVYERLVFDRRVAPSCARVAPSRDRLIVVNSFSKTYNMTGWRLGWAQGSERVIHQLFKAAEFITSNPPAMVQEAGIVALRDGEDFVALQQRQLARMRGLATGALTAMPRVRLPYPEGAFYVFPRIEGVADSAAFAGRLVRDTGLAVAPGAGFGSGGEGHIRICFASSDATVAEAMQRLGRFIADYDESAT
jgi:aspartate/methionine/tyrosine aminotransferase